MRWTQALLDVTLRTVCWAKYGHHYKSPVRPDRIVDISPTLVTHKPRVSPPKSRIPPTAIASGTWDIDLTPITADIVFRAFSAHFKDGIPWQATGYVDFLQTDTSEHASSTTREALDRCAAMDELYDRIDTHGYLPQRELEARGLHVDRISQLTRPPAYREVCVDVTRSGELVWHGGMHRLVIAQLLGVPKIPVRINTRHEQWQDYREMVWNRGTIDAGQVDHPDLAYFDLEPDEVVRTPTVQ